MRTLNELAELHKIGARKWLPDLVYYILPKLNEGWTYPFISKWLENEYGIVLSRTSISRAVRMYRKRYEGNVSMQDSTIVKEIEKATKEEVLSNNKDNTEIAQLREIDKPNLEEEVRVINRIEDIIDDSPEGIIRRQKKAFDKRFAGLNF